MGVQTENNGSGLKDPARELVTVEQRISMGGTVRKSISLPGVGLEGIKHPKHKELDQEGYDFARLSGAITENDLHKRTLEGRARAGVGELRLGTFDPQKNVADQTIVQEQEALGAERDEVMEQIRIAEGNLLDRKSEAVKAPPPTATAPVEPGLVVVLSALFLAIPLLPTAFDFWRLNDPYLNWSTAILISLGIGFPVAKLLFYVPSHGKSEPANTNLLGWFVAAGVAVGFGLIRLALGSTLLMAIGLTLLELLIILGIEVAARRYRHSLAEWQIQFDAHQKAITLVALQGDRVDELRQRLIGINAAARAIQEELFIRQLVETQPERVEESFVGSMLVGYLRGIAHNKAEYESHVRR
jgi:hypothetical protein